MVRTADLAPEPLSRSECLVSRQSTLRIIDLTHSFCDARLCYPVIGGALADRDTDHLPRVFAATLGPYLVHGLGKLIKTWG